jgi:hypothetical protein
VTVLWTLVRGWRAAEASAETRCAIAAWDAFAPGARPGALQRCVTTLAAAPGNTGGAVERHLRAWLAGHATALAREAAADAARAADANAARAADADAAADGDGDGDGDAKRAPQEDPEHDRRSALRLAIKTYLHGGKAMD